jgi:hypothetical protein
MSDRSAFMREVREGLAKYRETEVDCDANTCRDTLLDAWTDAQDVFELWLYTSKNGDAAAAKLLFDVVVDFCESTPRLMRVWEGWATRRQTERWVREAEGK